MKRLFTSFLFMMAGAFMTTALADSYKIWVGGVQVTDANKSNISPSGKTAGTISFEGATLTFNNVTMSTTTTIIRVETGSELTIKFYGTNTLTTTSAESSGIYSTAPLTLNGGDWNTQAELTVNVTNVGSNRGFHAIYADFEGRFNIYNLYLTLNASGTGAIVGKAENTTKIYTSCAEIKAKCAEGYAAIRRIGSWTMYDNGKLTNGDVFDMTDHRTENSDGDVSNDITLRNGLYFGSTMPRVGSSSVQSYSPQGLTAGTIKYDPSGKLTLDGVTMNTGGYIGIWNFNVPNLEIETTGTCKITSVNSSAISLDADTKFTGSGNLTLTSTYTFGITTHNGANVTVEMGELQTKGGSYGFYGEQAGTLTLNKYSSNSVYKFMGGNCNLYTGKLVTNSMDIWTPDSYFNSKVYKIWDTSKGGVACGTSINNDGTWFKSTDQFTYYPLYVAGTQVNSRNSSNISSQYITSGTVAYNTSTKTLTLTDATIVEHGNENTTDNIGILVQGEGVTINVAGTNNVNSGSYGILAYNNLTIGGSGNLNVNSGNMVALGLYNTSNDCTLTLQCSGGTHTFTGKTYGAAGWGNASLAIQKASGNGALYKFAGETANIGTIKSLNLGNGVKIHSRYTYFDEEKKAVYNRGNIAKTSDIAQGTWIRGDIEWIEYPLYVCDQQLYGAYVDGDFKGLASGFNCKQYTGTGITYNPESQTLNISSANIDATEVENMVYNAGIDGLKINLTGDNNIRVTDNIFRLETNTIFTGTGTLKGELTAYDGFGIWLRGGAEHELNGPTFEFKGQQAIGGYNSTGITINSGSLTYEPNDDGARCAIMSNGEIVFGEGMAIVEPQGAYYSTSLGAVTTDGQNVYRGRVVIEDSATPYALIIAGVRVNSANCTDILHNGVFAYDPETNTLTISGDCTFNGWIVDSNIEDLTINVVGNSTLTQQGTTTAIRLFANTTITGGKLTLVSEDSDKASLGIYNSVGTLTIKDADIEVVGDGFEYGITGESECSLVIDNSDVSVSAHSCGCISDWGSVNLTNCYIETPETSNIKANGIYNGAGDNLVGTSGATETLVIKAGELTGINELGVRSEELGVGNGQSTYDLNGRKVTTPEKGKIYIINGKKVKK